MLTKIYIVKRDEKEVAIIHLEKNDVVLKTYEVEDGGNWIDASE